MARLVTTDFDLSIAEDFLKRQQLRHVCAKRRADTLTLLTGPADDPWPRARFRIVTKQRTTIGQSGLTCSAVNNCECFPRCRFSACYSGDRHRDGTRRWMRPKRHACTLELFFGTQGRGAAG